MTPQELKALLDKLVAAVNELEHLSDHLIKQRDTEGLIRVICIVGHINGAVQLIPENTQPPIQPIDPTQVN